MFTMLWKEDWGDRVEMATQRGKIGPQCVRVATAFLFALVCEYGAV